MPDNLEVPGASHAKVIVAPPRINLRRAASYNAAQDANRPLSATSSRFNFNHLLFSPPPSPGLPALVPRPKRRVSNPILQARPSRLFRVLFYLVSLFTSIYFLVIAVHEHGGFSDIWHEYFKTETDMIGLDTIPRYATPFVVPDVDGQSKWAFSMPVKSRFPQSAQELTRLGTQCRKVSARARQMHHKTEQAIGVHDEYYIDVEEAEKMDVLRKPPKRAPSLEPGQFAGLDAKTMAGLPVCRSSMTFVLEGDNAGIGNTIMMLWTFYGLAKQDGRAFFIEDSRWAYGQYTEIFHRIPTPTCRPPPRHYILPCPAQARHLIVTSMTAKDLFPDLMARYRRAAGTGDQTRDLWQLAHTGYENLFDLSDEDADYVYSRIDHMKNTALTGFRTPNTPIIGLHIRRGDRHPKEFQYRDTYIPAEVFHQSAQKVANAHFGEKGDDQKDHEALLILASDDPMVHEEPDFQRAELAQERIRLASKSSMQQSLSKPAFIHKFVEEAFGWEGGFFASLFWNLGTESKNNAANAPQGVETGVPQEVLKQLANPSEQTLKLRSLIGRAYMMDLAVLAGASDSVVCATSAMGCRLLGVMMDWDAGVHGGHWVNVDGGYKTWKGIEW